MKILLALTDAASLETIGDLLLSQGHEFNSVDDGNELVEAMRENPDMVIMDANLPGISGYDCCRLIKHDDKNRLKPVVLLMPTQELAAWARFSECGADDFIELPLKPHVVKAKIKLLLRINELYQRLDASHRSAEQEIRIAKHMFDSITKRQPQVVDFMDYWGLSAGNFCGDLFIFERTHENHLHIFMGDFTGHGLAAAIGALPVSDIFFAMTRNGFGIERIVAEINRKLYDFMPTGKFCSAMVLRLDADNSKLEIWNGGLPPALLVDSQCKIVSQCESFHLPLGIAEPSDFQSQTQKFELSGIQSIVICSDGLIEARNSLGEEFGEDRLVQVIARQLKERNVFNKIKLNTLSFLEGLEPHDDISLAVININ
ncbi:MAG: SpoIIE family protein phosphatase [Gallionellaceae bacterium]|nr:SpoIIE family protein phosphatase [Gallionellaceae bacterium]